MCNIEEKEKIYEILNIKCNLPDISGMILKFVPFIKNCSICKLNVLSKNYSKSTSRAYLYQQTCDKCLIRSNRDKKLNELFKIKKYGQQEIKYILDNSRNEDHQMIFMAFMMDKKINCEYEISRDELLFGKCKHNTEEINCMLCFKNKQKECRKIKNFKYLNKNKHL